MSQDNQWINKAMIFLPTFFFLQTALYRNSRIYFATGGMKGPKLLYHFLDATSKFNPQFIPPDTTDTLYSPAYQMF